MQDHWTTVSHAQLEVVAEMMRGRLEAEGIEAVLRGNRAAGTAGAINELNISWGNPLGGVEVRVPSEDAARAREILAHDDIEPGDEPRRRATTPWWAKLYGLYLVAGLGLALAPLLSLARDEFFALGAVLLGVGVVLWVWSRQRKSGEI